MLEMENPGLAPEDREDIPYLQSVKLLEQAHRRLHEVVKDRLDRNNQRSLTGVQALILYEIGNDNMPAGKLRNHGVFVGGSLSYNLKKLQETGYVEQLRSKDDRRSVQLKLTASGMIVRKLVEDLFNAQFLALEPTASVRNDDLHNFNRTMTRLERFWSDQIRYQL